MAILRWQPVRPPSRELQSLFGTFFDSNTVASPAARSRWVPAIDLVEDGDHYVLRADLPGVKESDVKVELEDNVLTVSGERSSEQREQGAGYYRIERAAGRFSRSVRVPEGVDGEQIEANFENGVLDVRIPKPQERRPHRVAVSVGSKEQAAGDAEQQ